MRIVTSVTDNNPSLSELNNNNDKYLHLIACGRQTLTNTNKTFHCIRSEGTCKNYMLQLILSGKAYHTLNNKTVAINAVHCVLYKPNQPQNIIHYGADNADVIWMHFSGYGVEEILHSLELNEVTPLINNTAGFKHLLLQMTYELTTPSRNSELICQNYLLTFLLMCSQRIKGLSSSDLPSSKVRPAINHMLNNYTKNSLSIHNYAQMCYLSDSRFSHLFRDVTGTTPHKYILKLRIDNAKNLLATSNLAISEVAVCVGFSDPYHFSRVFSKNVGISPKQYKQRFQI